MVYDHHPYIYDIIIESYHMRKNYIFPITFLLTALSGCEVVGGIFKAGVWSIGCVIDLFNFIDHFWRRKIS